MKEITELPEVEVMMLDWIKQKHPEENADYGIYYDDNNNPHVCLMIYGRTHSDYTLEDIKTNRNLKN